MNVYLVQLLWAREWALRNRGRRIFTVKHAPWVALDSSKCNNEKVAEKREVPRAFQQAQGLKKDLLP